MKSPTLHCILICAFALGVAVAAAQTGTVHISVRTDSQSPPEYRDQNVCDGDPATFWHTEFRNDQRPPFPHWVELDLKRSETIRGVVYTPRQDSNNNGTFAQTEIYVYDDPEKPGEPVWKGDLDTMRSGPKDSVKIAFDAPAAGRFIRIAALSAFNGHPAGSAAEVQPIVDGKTFTTSAKINPGDVPGADAELVSEYNWILEELATRQKYDAIAGQIYDPQAGILPEDETPNDVIFRRTAAALERLEKRAPQAAAPFSAPLRALDPASVKLSTRKERFEHFEKVAHLRRRILFSDPDLNFDKILFVKKHRATYSHLCDQYYGVHLLPGGGIFLLENAFKTDVQPTVKNLLENSVVESGRLSGRKLTTGAFATLALDYDAQKIAFAYTEAEGSTEHFAHTDLTSGHWDRGRCLHIFTANADGSDLRQITDGTWNDFYPCFLPNGRIAFISERRGGYLRCGRQCPNFTVFDMNPDGSFMRCLSYHETNEWVPVVSHDGKIVWTRWDYIDRHSSAAHHPWVMTLNGSDPRQMHANYTLRHERSNTEMDLRPIPNSPKYIATAGLHHGQNYGSLVIIDPARAPEEETDP
ncbi:MAG: discoidin domain-containing protein, partial [Thermoguttaceae bacterium]|nr:discoidin domain-containing protein [Thermoguttaceae bacterium]